MSKHLLFTAALASLSLALLGCSPAPDLLQMVTETVLDVTLVPTVSPTLTVTSVTKTGTTAATPTFTPSPIPQPRYVCRSPKSVVDSLIAR